MQRHILLLQIQFEPWDNLCYDTAQRKEGMSVSILSQLVVIFCVYFVGEGLSALLPIPFPASVMGMVVLLVLLWTRILKPHQLEETSSFLLDHIQLFFIPTCVGILKYLDVVMGSLWAILLISILTTPLVFFVTGHVVQLTMRWMSRRKEVQE